MLSNLYGGSFTSYQDFQGLWRQFRSIWPPMVHNRWQHTHVHRFSYCGLSQEQHNTYCWLCLYWLRTCGYSNKTVLSALMLCPSQGAGNAQLAAFALPELLPNKWRHWAIVLADIGVFFAVVVGPVAGRFSVQHKDAVCPRANKPSLRMQPTDNRSSGAGSSTAPQLRWSRPSSAWDSFTIRPGIPVAFQPSKHSANSIMSALSSSSWPRHLSLWVSSILPPCPPQARVSLAPFALASAASSSLACGRHLRRSSSR